ncbi:hypothetical protein [Demequina salsinemoris]|uniref:hypothetical protein n=1 Tax=Demequina salsinemoris TaxID=577470 RepID=UPI0007851D5B|nr:hypothetical protein [Demequina salsinemoris]
MFLPETGVTGRVPLSIRLIGSTGIRSAIIVALIAVLYLVGLPLLDVVLRAPAVDAGRIVAAQGTSVVPPEDWAYDADSDTFHVFTQAGATLIVTPVIEVSGTLEEAMQPTRDQLEGDAEGQWVVSEPQEFETIAGDPAILLSAQNATDAQLVWIVQHDDQQVSVVMTSPATSLETVFGSAQALVESLRFSGSTS